MEDVVADVLGEYGAADFGLGRCHPFLKTGLSDLKDAVADTKSFPKNTMGRTRSKGAIILPDPFLSFESAFDVFVHQILCVSPHVRV